MAIMECFDRNRVDLGGGVSLEHRCSGHKFNRDETTRGELGERVSSHLSLSEWYPEQHAYDTLEVLVERED